MAEQVTISTFLELKDNMSKGLKRLDGMLQSLAKAAIKTNAAMRVVGTTLEKINNNTRAATRGALSSMAAQAKAAREAERLKQRQMRADARATEFAARMEQRRLRQAERMASKALQDAAKHAEQKERLEKKAANAAIRESRRVANAKLKDERKVIAEQARARKQQEISKKQEKKQTSRYIGMAGAAMFGPSLGGILSTGMGSLKGGVIMAGIAALEAGVEALKKAALVAFDVTRAYVLKVFDISMQHEIVIRRISNSLLSLNYSATFETATKSAEGMYEVLERYAAKLPGETEDYLEVFSLGLPMALMQGEQELEKFAAVTSKYTAYGFTRGMKDVEHMARDFSRLLQGRALGTTAMFGHLLPYLRRLGVEGAAEFNKLIPTERLRIFYEAIDKASVGFKNMENDADAVLGTMNSLVSRILRVGGKPLFESSVGIIQKINKFLEDNNSQITKFLQIISTRLGNALEGTVTKILDILTAIEKMPNSIDLVVAGIESFSYALGPAAITVYEIGRSIAEIMDALAKAGAMERAMRARQQTQEHYRKTSEAFLDPTVLKWLEKAPKVGGPALGAGETAVTRENEAQFKAFFKAGMKAGIPTEQMINVMSFRPDMQVRPELAEKWLREFTAPPISPASGGGGGGGRPPRTPRGAPKERQTTINDFRYSKFDIRQEFAEGFDPDRIAVAFASDLSKLGEMRMQSAYAPLYTSRY